MEKISENIADNNFIKCVCTFNGFNTHSAINEYVICLSFSLYIYLKQISKDRITCKQI